MTRRIPTALGIIIVLAALRELMQMVPLVMVALTRETSFLDAFFLLYVGGAVAQLVAGIAISVGWTHARFAVLAWSLASLAIVVFARDTMLADTNGFATITATVELLAGPAIAWIAPMLAGDTPPPLIPRAQIAGASPAADPLDVFARRFDVGVVLFGVGILWIANSVLSHAATFAMILRADRVSGGGGIAGELVYLAFAITVGVLAITAAKRCLDPKVEGQHAQRALATFVLVAVIGTALRTGLLVGYVSLSDSLGHVSTNVIVNSVAGAVIGCATPLFLWFYARPGFAYRAEGPPPLPSPARLASAPAWALLCIAPFLLVRLFAARTYGDGNFGDASLGSGALLLIGIVCAIEGVLFATTAIATLIATRSSNGSALGAANSALTEHGGSGATTSVARGLGVPRVTATIGLVIAMLVVAAWLLIAFTADQPMGMRGPAYLGPIVQLVACTATILWALSRRR